MDREVLFAETLEQVRKAAGEQGGCIGEGQVREAFAALELDEAQMQMVFDYLADRKIRLGGQDGTDEEALHEEISEDEALNEDLAGQKPSGRNRQERSLSERSTERRNTKEQNIKRQNMSGWNMSGKEKTYLQNYLDELERLPAYSSGEKEAYTILAMAGEADARKKLVEIYLKDVVGIARLYTGQGVSLEDLIGEGNMALTFGAGMLGGLEKPQEAEGTLARLIMGAMEDLIKENADNVKTDRQILSRVNEVSGKAKELSEELNRKVTVEELAAWARLSEKSIRDAMRISGFRIDYISGD